MNETQDMLRHYNRLLLVGIWRKMKAGEPLEGEERILGQVMQEHEEYHNTWEFADVLSDVEYDPESEVNPFLHITIHTVIENQLAQDAPKGIRGIYEKLMARQKDRHEVIHKIGGAFTEELWKTLKFKRPFNESRYLKTLRRIR